MVKIGNTTVTKPSGWEYYTLPPGVYYLTKQIHPKVAVIIRTIYKDAGMYSTNEVRVRRIVYKHPYSGSPIRASLDNIADDSEIDAMDNPYPEVVRKFLTNAMKKYGKMIRG